MKVYLAAQVYVCLPELLTLISYACIAVHLQVLSESVASALEYMDRDETIETRRFIRIMDVFFDCLNNKNPIECRQTPDDWRFKVSDVV